jgi:hypothetical protein
LQSSPRDGEQRVTARPSFRFARRQPRQQATQLYQRTKKVTQQKVQQEQGSKPKEQQCSRSLGRPKVAH